MGAAVLSGATAQRQAALVGANRVRLFRATVKRDLAAAPDRATALRWAGDHIADPAVELAGMRAVELLGAGRRMGPVSALRVLERAGIPAGARVRGLSVRQRLALLEVVGGGA